MEKKSGLADVNDGAAAEVAYAHENGVFKIATKGLLDRDVIVDVYDVRDLLWLGDADRRQGPPVPTLVSVIRSAVEPDSWRSRGGLVSAIEELNGQLVVTTTKTSHKEIADLLDEMRRSNAGKERG